VHESLEKKTSDSFAPSGRLGAGLSEGKGSPTGEGGARKKKETHSMRNSIRRGRRKEKIEKTVIVYLDRGDREDEECHTPVLSVAP